MRKLIITEPMSEFHHGDCIGWDALAHDMVAMLDSRPIIHVHPPSNYTNRAWKTGHVMHPEYDYLTRNIHIVNASEIMLAAPRGMTPDIRSGTWHAIKYAEQKKVRTIIVWPNGQIEDRIYE